MEYFNCFVGGPFDGGRVKSPYREEYPEFTLRQHVQNGLRVMAIYRCENELTKGNVAERHYKYVRSAPLEEAQRFLTEHGKMKPTE